MADYSHNEFAEWNVYGSEEHGRFAVVKPKVKFEVNNAFNTTIPSQYSRIIGDKEYELKDHLGNIRATLSDERENSTTAVVTSATSYLPFGMVEPNVFTSAGNHRFGFGGMEKDDEWKGDGNSLDFEARIYDPRIGRFLSLDPLANSFAWNSPFAYAENDVIRSIDLDGLEKLIVIYNFTKDKIEKSTIELNDAGKLGNGILVMSNYNGNDKYFYGNEIKSQDITGFKKAYEGTMQDKDGNHIGYKDSEGNPTIGYGHLIKNGESYKVGDKISENVAQVLFASDVKGIKSQVDKKLEAYNLNNSQYDALLDASFNMGPGKLNQFNQNDEKFSNGNFFLKFMKGGAGIEKRRYAENILYDTGKYFKLDILKGSRAIDAQKITNDAQKPIKDESLDKEEK